MTISKDSQDSIDRIISNIKSTIDKNKSGSLSNEESILELTEVISNDAFLKDGSETLSSYVTKLSEKATQSDEENLLSDEEIKEIFKEVLKPYLQSWLNQNLSKIVKEVVEQEVKSLFYKVNS
jgi:cell pole-organizing protein PopZ